MSLVINVLVVLNFTRCKFRFFDVLKLNHIKKGKIHEKNSVAGGVLVSSHAMANDQDLYNVLAKILYVEQGKAWVRRELLLMIKTKTAFD